MPREIKEIKEAFRNQKREYEMNLTRLHEQAEVEKQKALLQRERELQEQGRFDLKELYEKLEVLQRESQRLQLENALLKQNS
jgi:hypothetical protein